jgi:crotonobetainyl-CoA:carnitine CoA-transferase CaiB-like acyl-CoA transferase
MPGPFDGIRVVELSSEFGAYAGKLLADLGARVTLVEPPGGDTTREYPPFVGDVPDPERSLWFWHYNTNKLGVTLDLEVAADGEKLLGLLDEADVFLDAEPPARMRTLGLDHDSLAPGHPGLVTVSITPFGPDSPRASEQVTDLTLLAGGGPVWSCGYDDHTLPPVRGGGGQAAHIAAHYAVMGLLVALLARDERGRGQHVSVNMNAAANVTTEAATYGFLAAKSVVQRQTGRHAAEVLTFPTQVQCADGRYFNSGFPPRRRAEFLALIDWLRQLGFLDEFPLTSLLEMGADRPDISQADLREDPLVGEIFHAGRQAVIFVAERMPAYDVFVGLQQRGIPVGAIYSPEEVMTDPHFIDRGFPTPLYHEELGRDVTYPGAPYRFNRSPWELRSRAPRRGEHNEDVFGEAVEGHP